MTCEPRPAPNFGLNLGTLLAAKETTGAAAPIIFRFFKEKGSATEGCFPSTKRAEFLIRVNGIKVSPGKCPGNTRIDNC